MTPPDDNSWQPATFAERGVAVPLTSALLAGARVRVTERRCEMIVPHPAGARGVYILALSSVGEFGCPTLHDLQLLEQVGTLNPLTPSTMRQAARTVAAQGAAGRAAALAAVRNDAGDKQAEHDFGLRVLLSLMREGEGSTQSTPEQRAAQAILKLAGRTGRNADAVHADIERLARLVIACGLDGTAPAMGKAIRGRQAILLAFVRTTATAVLHWAETVGPASAASGVHFARSAYAICAAGRPVLDQAQQLVDDPATLLNAWAAAPEGVAGTLGRPGWLLDGWEGLCLAWQLAGSDDERAEAVSEACLLLPPVPPEADIWLGPAFDTTPLRTRLFAAAHMPNRPPSHIVATVARNERARALAA